MFKESWVAMIGSCVLLATSAAQAHLVTLDANAYASGTDISGAFDGVTLSHVTFTEAGRQSGAVYAVGCSPEARGCDGTNAFAWQKDSGKDVPYWSATSELIGNCLQQNHTYCYERGQQLLEVSLEEATDLIQFDSSLTYLPWAWAFDAAGNLLSLTPVGTFDETLGRGSMTLSSAAGNISRLIIGGNDGYSIVNSISYNAKATNVPEPQTLGLLMAGLLGVVVSARQRRKRAAMA
jgi:hypothetical protein